jgi:ATP-dependent DNA helicase RecQ
MFNFITTTGDYPLLRVPEKGKVLLNDRMNVTLSRPVAARDFGQTDEEEGRSKYAPGRLKSRKKSGEDTLDYNKILFEQLRVLRKSVADKKRVPPFIIFGDVSLREMAFYLPQDSDSFMQITGVGRKKLAEYGEVFLAVIRAFAEVKK